MNQYQYQYFHRPLPPNPEFGKHPPFTRLLLLAPGTSSQPFRGHLEIVDVEQWTNQYEALSYTWGTEDVRSSIWLEGNRPLPIKPNLETALQHLRLPTQARRLWIDAICIDQSNLEERSRQVQYMSKVYKHAARVIVWLGLKSPGVDEAFEAARKFAEGRAMIVEDSASRVGEAGPVDQEIASEFMLSLLEGLDPTAMQHLIELFNRPYFVRSWCIQEVVVCSWAIARCEELEIPFLDLIATAHSVLQVQQLQGKVLPENSCQFWNMVSIKKQPNFQLKSEVEGSIGSLLELLIGTREFKATDPRDKIFSLFGICDEGIQPVLALTQVMGDKAKDSFWVKTVRKVATSLQDHINNIDPSRDFARPAALKPDYTKDTVSVYCDVTRFQIRASPRMLDVLDHVQHNGDPAAGEFPSWVPKWFEPRSCSTLGMGCFLAGLCDGHFRYFAEIHDSPLTGQATRPRVLSLDGYRVDLVQTISEVIAFGVLDAVPVEQIWSQLFSYPFVRPLRHLYATGEPLDVEFCKTLQVSPLGAAMIQVVSDTYNNQSISGRDSNFTETIEQRAHSDVAHFITSFARQREVPMAAYQSLLADAEGGDSQRFAMAVHSLSYNRRVFLTRDGRLGLGPKMMQPGDEIVALFGGRMPFVLRPRLDHHLLVGDCYIRDDNLMWGKMTERVRFKRGGPPVSTFELR